MKKMNITVRPKPNAKDVLLIFLDDELWSHIHIFVFGKKPSFPDTVNSLEEWQAFFDEAEYRYAKNYVLRRLSAQNYYSGRLEKLLHDRLIRSHTVVNVLNWARSLGYLNDRAWLDAFIRAHVKRHSFRAIIAKLRTKGVPPEEIRELVEERRVSEEEEQAIRHLIQTRYRNRDFRDFKERQKVAAALARKGYSFELIRSALESVSDFSE